MADPASQKVTLLAALAAVVGPLVAEYSVILFVAIVGGFIGLSVRAMPLPGIVRPLLHVLSGAALAAFVVPAAVLVVLAYVPTSWALTVDLALPVVALAVAIWWHPAITEWAPAVVGWLLDKVRGAGGKGPAA